MVSFEDAKAFLLQSDSNGANLYDHLSDVLLKLIESRPTGALQNFENISNEVKTGRLPPSDGPSPYNEVPDDYFDDKLAASATKLFKSAFPPAADGEEAPAPNEGEFSDIVDEAANFEWAGVSLGKEETFRLSLAVKQLVEANPLKSARFFGKIFGRDADYYVVESEYKEDYVEPEKPAEEAKPADDEDEEEEEKPVETKPKKDAPIPVPVEVRKGTNFYTYWVTSTPGEAWVKLPPVTPEQITTSRLINKFLTGRLDAEVASYPPFPGKEINYLRAQIARIGAATVISPKGYYSVEEDDDSTEVPPLNVNADFEGLSNTDLLSSSNWAHHQPHILPQGRAEFASLKPPKDEDAEEAEDEETPEEEEHVETGPKLLTDIAADEAISDKFEAWTIRQSTTRSKYSNVIVRSNRWPGAFAYASSNGTTVKFANIYVGFGLKHAGRPYSPPFPPAPQVVPPLCWFGVIPIVPSLICVGVGSHQSFPFV
eukprot:TRINITY_DN5268_c0_g2_i1.p1 TRINITY_DN5268_c0_g2~~TRINITY_DN5268_c0_g2_i1.p1  ORF type:complete len:485 (-),score=139.57 TRINITY_DN5268_c0_g2_i1:849-2303(-)